MNNFIELVESALTLPKGLEFIEQQIQLLFYVIAQTKSIDNAELVFKNLEDIQFVLAKATFKNDINLSPFLNKFVDDFDRIDDIEVKNFQYKQIKSALNY